MKTATKPSERMGEVKPSNARAEDSPQEGDTTAMRSLTVQEIERLLKSEQPTP